MMDDVERERLSAAALPDGSLIAVLLDQHARIRLLFEQVDKSDGDAKQVAFDRLRELLAIHETGEEIVLRPLSRAAPAVGADVAQAHNDEEQEATRVLAQLEQLDVHSDEFAVQFADFEKAVSQHASSEESVEFPHIASTVSAEELQKLGARLERVQTLAPTHAHPGAVGHPIAHYAVGPFAALLDKARDAFSRD